LLVIFWKASKPHLVVRQPSSLPPEPKGNNFANLGKESMTCVPTASTSAKMQNPTVDTWTPQHRCRNGKRCTYVIVGHSDAGLLFVSSTLSMSHLGRWIGPGLLIELAMGSVKPHVRRWHARPVSTTKQQSSCCYACNIRALQVGLQGVLGPSQLTSGSV